MKNRGSSPEKFRTSFLGDKYTYIALMLSILCFWASWVGYFGYSPDYENYYFFFDLLRFGFSPYFSVTRFEPSFTLISRVLVAFVNSNELVYALFVFPCVFFKIIFIGKWSKGYIFFFLSVILYLTRFFPLHELTQIRESCALIFISVALYFRVIDKLHLTAVFGLVAFTFHYSSALIIPFLFLPDLKAREVVAVGLGIFLGIFVLSSQIVPIAATYFTSIQDTLRSVVDSEGLRPLSPILFPEYFMIIASLLFWGGLTRVMRVIVSLQVFGLAMGFAFYSFPVIAVRSHELYTFLWIFYVAQAHNCRFEIRISTFAFVAAMAALGFYVYYSGSFFVY